MAKRTLLIVTSPWDSHADHLISLSSIELQDWKIVRLHPEHLATNVDIEFEHDANGLVSISRATVIDSGRCFKNVDVIWWRKPDWPRSHPKLTTDTEQDCSREEYKELILSLAGVFPHAKWVNEYWQMRRYSYKLNQIAAATRFGFKVPPTIIPKSIASLKSFLDRHGDLIAKPMTYAGFANENESFACWTNVLTRDFIDSLSDADLAFAPFLVQKRIFKAKEFRVTVVGDTCFWCSIQTDPNSPSGIDFRIADSISLQHRIEPMPKGLNDKLTGITRAMGLNYGAFDIIQDQQGDFYMLEINPNGQYLWIERMTGAPITQCLCSLIKKLVDD